MAKVTIHDVAREAGVALGTVSNAINHPERLRTETLRAVLDAVDRLGYAPNQSARVLAGGRAPILGLVVRELSHGMCLQIANGAQTEARRRGYQVMMASADGDKSLESRYLRSFADIHVAGLLVQPLGDYGRPPRVPGGGELPVAYLDFHSEVGGRCFGADNRAQGRLIAEHAVERHARRVAVIGEAGQGPYRLRAEGIEQVARRAGRMSFEFLCEGAPNRAQDGFDLGRALAARAAGDRPDFVIGLSDVLATGAIAGIRAAGLTVPGDMAVAGCDGNPLAWNGPVPLTTVAPPGYEIGRRAARYLIAKIDRVQDGTDADDDRGRTDLVRPFLLRHESSGATEDGGGAFADPGLSISGYL